MLQLVHRRLAVYGNTVIQTRGHPLATVEGEEGALEH